MKGLLTFVALSLLVVLTAVALQQQTAPTQHETLLALSEELGQRIEPLPGAEVGEGKSAGRKEYQWLRLRDPATGEIPRGIRSRERAFAAGLPVREQIVDKAGRRTASQEWEFRGPNNVGGRTRALAVDIANPDRILSGGVTGGLWISEDAGITWRRTSDLSVTPLVSCVEQDIREGETDVWYYGTGEFTGSGSRSINSRIPHWVGDGIFKSYDGGETWQQLPSTVSPIETNNTPWDVVFRIAVNPTNDEADELYAATLGTIHRSLDGGESWELMLGQFDSQASMWTDVMVTSDGTVYATLDTQVTDGGLWRSTDGGESWEQLEPAGFPTDIRRMVMDSVPLYPDLVYFLGETPGFGYQASAGWYSLWKLEIVEGVDIWSDLSANMPNLPNQTELPWGYDFNSQGGYNMHVTIFPTIPQIVYIGGTSLFRSDDGFTTDTSIHWIGGYNRHYNQIPPEEGGGGSSYPNHHADCHNLVFDPVDPSRMYSSHDGGISITDNPFFVPADETPFPWDYVEGYLTTQFYWVATDKLSDGATTILGGMQDNGTWMALMGDALDPWYELTGGDGMACEIGAGNQDNSRSFYGTSQYGGTFARIELTVGDWQFIDYSYFQPPGDFSDNGWSRWITPYHTIPPEYRAMACADLQSIWVSEDVPAESAWSQIPGSRHGDKWVTAIGVSHSEEGPIYYSDYDRFNGAETSRVYRINNAFINPSVIDITPEIFPDFGWVHCIEVDPLDQEHVIVVFTNYNVLSLFETVDGGVSWQQIGGNLEENPDGSGNGPSCFWAEIVHVDEGQTRTFVGTTAGLYSTTELNGENTVWAQEGADVIGQQWVTAMDVRDSDNFVAVGTHGGGTYAATIQFTGAEEQSASLPLTCAITSVYPNPFNASSQVVVSLPRNGQLELVLYNALGQRVQQIAAGEFLAGRHRFNLDGRRLASGTYFVQLRAGDSVTTRRAVVLK